MPVFTEYSNVHLNDQRQTAKINHWRKLIINATEQCGRNRLTVLDSPLALTDWLIQDQNQTRLILHPGQEGELSAVARPQGPLSLLTGPEGGFSETEMALAMPYL